VGAEPMGWWWGGGKVVMRRGPGMGAREDGWWHGGGGGRRAVGMDANGMHGGGLLQLAGGVIGGAVGSIETAFPSAWERGGSSGGGGGGGGGGFFAGQGIAAG